MGKKLNKTQIIIIVITIAVILSVLMSLNLAMNFNTLTIQNERLAEMIFEIQVGTMQAFCDTDYKIDSIESDPVTALNNKQDCQREIVVTAKLQSFRQTGIAPEFTQAEIDMINAMNQIGNFTNP